MRIGRVLAPLCALGCLMSQAGRADIDPAEYELKASVRSASERTRLEAGFALDREKEAERQRLEAARETQRLAAEKAAWEAQPHPVRLTRTRCAACHTADKYENQRHNRVGWELVILRMQILNDAPLSAGERSEIARHLAQTYPASGAEARLEVLQQLAVALFPVGFWMTWKVVRSGLRKGS